MERCTIILKNGDQCRRRSSLVEKKHLGFYHKKTSKDKIFIPGELWSLKNLNGVWKPVCKLHFNMYHRKENPW